MTWNEFEEIMLKDSYKLTEEELAEIEFIIENYKLDWI